MRKIVTNPANDKHDSMWDFLKDGAMEPNLPALKNAVYTLIKMSTQMTAGQRPHDHPNDMPFDMLDIVKWTIVCEACALVTSGALERLEEKENDKTE